jgi:hypothetical protein
LRSASGQPAASFSDSSRRLWEIEPDTAAPFNGDLDE